MGGKHYLPSNVLEFQSLVHNVQAKVAINLSKWGISSSSYSSLNAPVVAFDNALRISEDPATRTPAAIRLRDDLRATLEGSFRPFVQGQLYHNPLVTDADLLTMGLPPHDHTPTSVPPPDKEPELEFATPSPAIVEIRFSGKDEKGHAKPKGVHGLELRWTFADTPPIDWSELAHSEFATHSPLRLTFEGHDRGKWLYVAARWESTRGETGPWTEIVSAIVP
jgi:hypothetical protein